MGWGTGNLGVGGGASLNFKVVCNPQPTNPKENTIWLNTDVPIGRWYFSATQPEGLREGDVWFLIDTSSPVAFNALKKNGIHVYPISSKQHVGGDLVDVTAMSYQGGSWVVWWNGELFLDGNQFESITGGWEAMGFAASESWHSTVPTLEIAETMKMGLSTTGSSTYSGVVITKKKINLTDWDTLTVFTNKLVVTKKCIYSSGVAVMILNSNDNSKLLEDVTVKIERIHSGTTAVTKTDITTTLDVSDLSGDYYVAVRVLLSPDLGGSSVTADIANMLLFKSDSISAAAYQAELAAAYQEGVNSAYD